MLKVVADIFRSGFDILHMIDYIGKIYKYNPIIIATGDIINNNMINNVLTAGCNHYMKYPIHTDSLISTILMLSKVAIINAITSTPADSKNNKNIDITVSLDKMLSDIGIPYNILGRKFITDAVIYIMKYCGGYLSGIHITKDIYPYVAEKNKTTSPRVERNIRHAIERAYNSNHSAENINKYFGNSYSWNRDKPTNAEFLSCVCNKLLLEYGMEV